MLTRVIVGRRYLTGHDRRVPFGGLPKNVKRVGWGLKIFGNPLIAGFLAANATFFLLLDYARYGYVKGVSRALQLASDWVTVSTYYDLIRLTGNGSQKEMARCHEVAADFVVDRVLRFGGIYTKMGQLASSLHQLPLEWVIPMKSCLDHTSTMSPLLAEICLTRSFESGGLGAHVTELFSDFDRVPVKAASLAQVHVGWGLSNPDKKYAVKIQYQDVANMMNIDVAVLSGLVKFIKMTTACDLRWVHTYFKECLKQEVDFLKEGRNCEWFRTTFSDRDDVTAPEVVWDRSSPGVLTMEYVEGKNIDEAGRKEAVKVVSEVIGRMVFKEGYLHADPHPANIFVEEVQDGWRLQWLDHGLYQRLTPDFMDTYSQLCVGVALSDPSIISEACTSLSIPDASLATSLLSPAPSFTTTSSYELLNTFGAIPSQMVPILKCNSLITSLQSQLKAPDKHASIMARFAVERYNAWQLRIAEETHDPAAVKTAVEKGLERSRRINGGEVVGGGKKWFFF